MNSKRKEYLKVNDGRVTINSYIDAEYRDRLDSLAMKTGIARSRLCGNILNAFIELYERYPEFLSLIAAVNYDEQINMLMLSLAEKQLKQL